MQNCALGLNRCCSHCGGVRRCPCGLTLYHDDKKLGEGRIKTQPGMFSLAGEGLCIGRDSGEPVTDD